MELKKSPLFKNSDLRNRLIILFFSLFLIIAGKITKNNFEPARWMTYRNFDVAGEKNFINYLLPGVEDQSSNKKYDFTKQHWGLLFGVLFLFFPIMFILRIIFDMDFKLKVYRYITQWLTFVIARMGIFRVTGVCPVKRTGLGVFPFVNCQSCELATGACPIGTFQMSMLNGQIPYMLMGQIMLVGLISGRLICGWLCPFGFLSDIFDKLSKKKIKLHINLTYIKYFILGILVFSSIAYFFKEKSEFLFYCSFLCPAGFFYGVLEYALTTGLHGLIKDFPFIHFMLIYHFMIAALFIFGSIKIGGRFYCKYMCPLGAVYGLFNKMAFIRLGTNKNKCTGCKACEKVCPMHISILDKSLKSRSSCIVCTRCKKVCPTNKIQFFTVFDQNINNTAKVKN